MKDNLFSKIEDLEGRIFEAEGKLLSLKHRWLRNRGWEISDENQTEAHDFLYTRDNISTFLVDSAMDLELCS